MVLALFVLIRGSFLSGVKKSIHEPHRLKPVYAYAAKGDPGVHYFGGIYCFCDHCFQLRWNNVVSYVLLVGAVLFAFMR